MKKKSKSQVKKVKAWAILTKVDSFKGKQFVIFPWENDSMDIFFRKEQAKYIQKLQHERGQSKLVEVVITYSLDK